MALTSKLGHADSKLGNIQLATGTSPGGRTLPLAESGISGIPSGETFGRDAYVSKDQARITQLAVEAFTSGTPSARITQLAVEAFTSKNPSAIVPWFVVDILELVNIVRGLAGIASAQAFGSGGSLTVADPFQTITGTAGIASAEAFGSPGSAAQIYSTSGIASAEAFGSGGKVLYPQTISGAAGIASAGAFGSGASVSGPVVGSSGIASAEAFGSTGVISGNTLYGSTGIVSGETFGSGGSLGSIGGPIEGLVGIPPGGMGVGSVAGPISGSSGIASAEAFGTTGFLTSKIVGDWGDGIPSQETFGTPGRLYRGLGGLIGIPSEEAFGGTGAVLLLDETNSNFAVFIAGNNRTPYVLAGSIRVDRQLNFQASASFGMIDEAGAYFPEIGDDIIIYYFDEDIQPDKPGSSTWERIFGGTVDSFEYRKEHVTDAAIQFGVTCCDYGKSLSKRIVNAKFAAASFGSLQSIMDYLSAHYLAAEGVTYIHRGEPAGVTWPDLEFAYLPLNEVLDRLAEVCGWEWQVDFWKNLYVYDRPATVQTAPFDITEETTGVNGVLWSDLRVSKTRGLYRNRQLIKGAATTETSTLTLHYICPSDFEMPPYDYVLSWELMNYSGYMRAPYLSDSRYNGNIARITKLEYNGAEVPWFSQWADDSLSVPNVAPPGWKWMQIWPTAVDLAFNVLGNAPVDYPKSGDTLDLTVEITTTIPPPTSVEDSAEILAHGVYESFEELPEGSTPAFMAEYAQALLDRFGVFGQEVDFRTFRFGLEPGQELTCNLPGYGINAATMNVEGISYQDIQKRVLEHAVKISNQIQQRDALTAFHRLMKKLRKPSRSQQQVVTWDLALTYQGITNPGLMTGTSLGNTYILRRDFTCDNIIVFFKTPPTGAAVRINIKADGVSILPDGYIEYGAGVSTPQTFSSFVTPPLTLAKGTKLTIDVTQVGSIQPGKDGTVHLAGYV